MSVKQVGTYSWSFSKSLTNGALVFSSVLVLLIIFVQNKQISFSFFKPMINTRKDITIANDLIEPETRLSYTAFILPTVKRIRAKNFVFERDGIIPESEQLEYCSNYINIHICTDNRYPIMHRMDGVIELQESSHNKDLWN